MVLFFKKIIIRLRRMISIGFENSNFSATELLPANYNFTDLAELCNSIL